MHLHELNNCFNETKSRLLICMECLRLKNSFSIFDKAKLIQFAKFYPIELCPISLKFFDNQLETYIVNMHRNVEFASLKGTRDLSKKFGRNQNAYCLSISLSTFEVNNDFTCRHINR